MKKLIVFLLATILIAGCVQTNQLGKEVQVGQELGITEYDLRVGGTITVDNKVVRLESFDSGPVTVFDVDGTKREMTETQDPQIINGLEVTLQKFKYDASDMDNNYVHVKILKYVPKEDEYLFYLNDVKKILDYNVELLDIQKDGTIVVMVDNANQKRIMEGKTELVNTLYISNVRPNHRAIGSERYAIVKVTEKV